MQKIQPWPFPPCPPGVLPLVAAGPFWQLQRPPDLWLRPCLPWSPPYLAAGKGLSCSPLAPNFPICNFTFISSSFFA